MTINTIPIINLLHTAVGSITPAAQLVVRWRGEGVLSTALGWLDPETCQQPTQPDTRFDMASVSKLFTVTTLMTLVEAGQVTLDTPVGAVLPEFNGTRPVRPYEDPLNTGKWVAIAADVTDVDAGRITFRHLLTHTAGLPAWRPLYQQADAAAARHMALTTFFSYQPGARVVYSDIGLILLGMSIERLTGLTLDAAVQDHVITPLGLTHTHYLPPSSPSPLLPLSPSLPPVAPTEFCQWRQRRIVAAVHDENAYQLGGVAGHAGLFSTATDIAAFGQGYLDGGAPLLSAATVHEMARPHTAGLNLTRGLGFALWSPDPEASSNPFSPRAFGHTGFTGTSLWIDPTHDIVVALLTNDVYYGRVNRGIGKLRVAVHRAIVAAIDAAA